MNQRNFSDATLYMKQDDQMVPLFDLQPIKYSEITRDNFYSGGNGSPFFGSGEATFTLSDVEVDINSLKKLVPISHSFFQYNLIKNTVKSRNVEFTITKDRLTMKYQNKEHKRSRINKKWAKRYGFTEIDLKNFCLQVVGEMYDGQRFRFDSKSFTFSPID